MRFNSDAAIDLVLRGIIGFTRLFGYCTRVKLFGFIASYVVAPVFGYIKKAVRNLQLVHPDMSTREARKIAHEVATNFGKNMIENYNKHDVAAALKPENIGGAGYDQMMVAIAEGRPVMLVSGHIGNYEAMRIALYTLGHQSACLFRPASNPHFDEHYTQNYGYLTGPAFPQSRKGFLGFIRHLREGGIATMLFDVRATQYQDVDFFGIPAPTSDVPAKIAMKTGALFVPCFTHRGPDGMTHHIDFETPIEHSTSYEMMAEMSDRLEAQVRRFPAQWLWFHDRWGTAEVRAQRVAAKLETAASGGDATGLNTTNNKDH
ncbi:MAG: lysophospholipid acyltransferase family protein [Ascidiaceihabitans sp.]|jgi:KDO2-lipid IV(A) lauroyltransferase|tara:strand:- start:279 stop:1232 length:954 start_codon:yes stop_codon:yes gene_type:complete